MDAEELAGRIGAAAFAGMGAVALIAPDLIPRRMGMAITSPAGRGEVRAVYGGFGLAVAGALVTGDHQRKAEARRAAGTALLGMLAGRLVDVAVTRQVTATSGLVGTCEGVLGVALLRA